MQKSFIGRDMPPLTHYPRPMIEGTFNPGRFNMKSGTRLKNVPGALSRANESHTEAIKILEGANSFMGHTFIGAEGGSGALDFLFRYNTALRYLNIIYGAPGMAKKFEKFMAAALHGYTYSTRLSPLLAVSANALLGRDIFDRKIIGNVPAFREYFMYPNRTISDDIYFGGNTTQRELSQINRAVPRPKPDDGVIRVLDIGCAFNGAAGSPALRFAKKALAPLRPMMQGSIDRFEFYGIDLMLPNSSFPVLDEEKKEWVFVDNYKFNRGVSAGHPDRITYLNALSSARFDISSEKFNLSQFGKFHVIFCTMVMPSLILRELKEAGRVPPETHSTFSMIGTDEWGFLEQLVSRRIDHYIDKIRTQLAVNGILFFCPTVGIPDRDDYHVVFSQAKQKPVAHIPFSVDLNSQDFRWWIFRRNLKIDSDEKKGAFFAAMRRLLLAPYSPDRAVWVRMSRAMDPKWRDGASIDDRIAFLGGGE